MTERDRNVVETRLGLPSAALGLYMPRYNIAPTQFHFVVTAKYENRESLPARWGLVPLVEG